MPSLYGGLALGSAFIVAGATIQSGSDFRGHIIAAVASTILVGTGTSRYLASKKLMPAVPMLIIGMSNSVRVIVNLIFCFICIGVASSGYHFNKVYEWS